MIRYPKILLILLVLLPLLLLGWGGMRLMAYEKKQVEENVRQLLTERLSEIDRIVAGELEQLAAGMQELTSIDSYAEDALRELVRGEPQLFQLFVIDSDDVLVYPTPAGPHTSVERDFILKASELINDKVLQRAEQADANESSTRTTSPKIQAKTFTQAISKKSMTRTRSGRWFVWFWGPGMNLIYWQRRPNGHIVGVALERSRWVADLIAKLPDTPVQTEKALGAPSRIQIVESGADVIYKWGAHQPAENSLPAAELQFSHPLSAWELQTFVPAQILTTGRSGKFALIAGLIVSALALIVMAVTIDREYGREMQEAQRRVSFVNQVSHELRTPLTNIRMYAELLEADLEQEPTTDERSIRRLNVILTESQRLSRLIGNVLTFARQERDSLKLCCQHVVPDAIIQSVLESFQPSLDHKKIELEADLNSSRPMSIDADVLEQILGNLISNVEKYAADGKWLRVSSREIDGGLELTVADHGTGIPGRISTKVFEPFWGASDDLNHAAGTGIGLSIVKSLAELHGGTVELRTSSDGAIFVVTLQSETKETVS